MKHDTSARYRATGLEIALDAQGRRRDWLADQMDVSGGYITAVIKGRKTVNRATAEKISKVVGAPIFWLFDMSDDTSCSSNEHESEAIPA